MSTAISNFDFDAVTAVLAQSQSPGNEQRDFWSLDGRRRARLAQLSRASRTRWSMRWSTSVIFATDREDLVAATHALDRVLLWNFYVVPQWHLPKVWIAYWDKFGMPEKQPSYVGVDTDSWWIDPEKEAALAAKYKCGELMPAGALSRRRFPGARRRRAGRRRPRPPGLRRDSDRDQAAWSVGLRRPEVPGEFRPSRLRQPGGAEGRNVQFPAAELAVQPEHADLQHVEFLRSEGRRAAAHGTVLRFADDRARSTSPTRSTGWSPKP